MVKDIYLEEEIVDDIIIDFITDLYIQNFKTILYIEEKEKIEELYSLLLD